MALVAAVNPLAIAVALWPRERWQRVAASALVALAGAVAAALGSGPILDALDVTPGTFRVATAVVLGLASARWLIVGAPPVSAEGPAEGWNRVGVPILVPVIVTPQLAMVSLSVGADDGVALVAIGVGAGLAAAWLLTVVTKRRQIAWTTGVRFVAAVALTVALALAVDGVKTV